MGKGRRERELPFGHVTAQALRRYVRTVADHDTGDPFFISRTGRRLTREGVASAMRNYAKRAGIDGYSIISAHAPSHGRQAVHPQRR